MDIEKKPQPNTFRLNPEDSRFDLSLKNSFSDEWVGKGSRDKRHGGKMVRRVCPDCGHHAFDYSSKDGWFLCWHCHIHGRLQDAEFLSEEEKAKQLEREARRNTSLNVRNRSAQPGPSTPPAPGGEGGWGEGAVILSDYMPLAEDELETIEDISLDPVVSGNQDVARHYLKEIGITPEQARRYHLGVATRYIKTKKEDTGKNRTCIAFRNYVDGYCCNVKFRSITTVSENRNIGGQAVSRKKREKGFDQLSSFTPCAPYNIDCINPQTFTASDGECPEQPSPVSRLFITEGEKDCLTLLTMGCERVISVASGANTNLDRSFEAFREWLAPIKDIVICGDQDQRGRELTAALFDYFASKKVYACRWDQRLWGKDITDVRCQHGDEKARDIISNAQLLTREDILDFTSDDDESLILENLTSTVQRGYSVGIGRMTDEIFRLTDSGGLMVLTGVPGTGKTDFLNFLTTSLIRERNAHVAYCSFETPDKHRHMASLTKVWMGEERIEMLDRDVIMPRIHHITSHVSHIEMRRDSPTPQRILSKAEAVYAKHPNMQFLVIDPYLYMELTVNRNVTETNAIKKMLTTLQDWAHDHRVWVFIVAHPRMLHREDGSDEFEEVTYYTISGSANWANISDYIGSLKRIKGSDYDYTRFTTLKVRDQEVCRTGEVYYKRSSSGRYLECEDESSAKASKVINHDDAFRVWEIAPAN